MTQKGDKIYFAVARGVGCCGCGDDDKRLQVGANCVSNRLTIFRLPPTST